jgi:hypothetical protein
LIRESHEKDKRAIIKINNTTREIIAISMLLSKILFFSFLLISGDSLRSSKVKITYINNGNPINSNPPKITEINREAPIAACKRIIVAYTN